MGAENGKRLGDVLLDHLDRDAQLVGYLAVLESFKAAHGENLAAARRQLFHDLLYLAGQFVVERVAVGGALHVGAVELFCPGYLAERACLVAVDHRLVLEVVQTAVAHHGEEQR